MTTSRETRPDNVSDYLFESIVFESERLSITQDIKPIVTDLEIYESLDIPYLTGKLVLVDNSNFIHNSDILGGEKIVVSLRSTKQKSLKVTKTFYISEVVSTVKNDDHTEVSYFELLEDIGFISNVFNVNKFYSGFGSVIIEKISKEYLGKEIEIISSDNSNMNLIVPNLEPIDAMLWIRNRLSTVEGYPFYLFSTLNGSKIGLADLGTLLQLNPVNETPYRGHQSASVSDLGDNSERVLNGFRFEKSENLYQIIHDGLMGAEYQYIDTLSGEKNKINYDVVKDLLKPLINSGVLGDQKNVLVTNQFKINDKPLNEIKSRRITRVGGTNAFKTADDFNLSYDENKLKSDYKKNIISHSMSEILQKAPLTLSIDGLDFINSNSHFTIGNNLKIEFLNSVVDNDTSNRIDVKKSGNYLIYSARHIFKKERYDLVMTGVKMGNLKRL